VQINELGHPGSAAVKFLEQILTQLKEAGYVDSKRGKYGPAIFWKMQRTASVLGA